MCQRFFRQKKMPKKANRSTLFIYIFSCISFGSAVYLSFPTSNHNQVRFTCSGRSAVYLSFPTSNHNYGTSNENRAVAVYLSFPTSNHNIDCDVIDVITLFISLFLHQTTTRWPQASDQRSCLSLFSYIKPQLLGQRQFLIIAVYLSFPTSNHNPYAAIGQGLGAVYLSFPTSNHNLWLFLMFCREAVYLSFPTSNHNCSW